jgi:8-oxo-dGTP pyrophosphatase MutT (NUDIX family)
MSAGMIEEFKQKLKKELSFELPGEAAHLMMMPTARDEKYIFPSFSTPPVKSAVLILFYTDRLGNIRFPLIQRPTYNGAHSGQVGIPGGKAEPIDRDLVHTALRETEEEIGINATNIEVVGKLSELHIGVSNFIVTPVVGFLHSLPTFILDKQEVDMVIEADVFDILKPERRKEGTITVRGEFAIQAPYFEIENRVVWGATAMMLNELSIIIDKSGLI